MLQGPKDQPRVAAALFGGQCVLPLAASGVYPKSRVWGSKPENVHCSSATTPLKIELRWGCEECSEKTAVGSGVTFKYDPFGRRIYKSSSAGTSVYAYDGDNLMEETNSSGAVVARYAQTQNIDEPLAMLRSAATSYHHADGLGSVTSLSSAAGAIINTYTYDSFGKLTTSTGSLVNPFQYTARESDTETGLYYYRARYYDPQTGRFIREDPTKEVIRGLNFYAYVHNNAPNFLDPKGRGPNDWLKKIGEGLKFGHEVKEQIDKALDWTFCGLYALTCTDSGINLKYDISQAQGTGTDAFINSTEALARSVGANSASDLNRKVGIVNDPCRHFLEDCTKFATPNPF
jgi:RHS repeat-associated protein